MLIRKNSNYLITMTHTSKSLDIVAIETASYAAASLAVSVGGECHAVTLPDARAAARDIVPTLQNLCADLLTVPTTATQIVVDCGPGSFTGIRIGLASAYGLADGWKCRVRGVSQFDLIPTQHDAHPVLIALDARANRGYYCAYRPLDAKESRSFYTHDELHAFCAGKSGVIYTDAADGFPVCEGWRLHVLSSAVHARDICAYALKASSQDTAPPLPLYLHTRYSASS